MKSCMERIRRVTECHTTRGDLIIEDRSGAMHVFLSSDGDHIVTKLFINAHGEPREVMLPHGEWAWDRAVNRAQRAMVFL